MGISKLSSLFAANIDQVPAVRPGKPVTPQAEQTQAAPQGGSDAVVLSNSLRQSGRVPLGDAESARAARVQKLKADVRGGNYKPDRAQVAMSVIRDLA